MKISLHRKKSKPRTDKNEGGFLSPRLQLIAFIAILALIFFALFNLLYKMPYSGTPLYFNFASKVLEGNVPYRDFSLEYPPFALFFFILPRFFTSGYWTYAALYRIEVFIFILIGLFVLYYIARRSGKAPWRLFLFYTIAILAIGPIIAEQYDIFPAVLTLLALYYFWSGKHKISWALIALGALTKIYPIFIAPLFLIYYIRNREYRHLWSGVATLAAVILAVLLPFFVISFDSLKYLVYYHSQRGLQVESIYSSVLLVAEKFGLISFQLILDFGSWNLVSPVADSLARVSTYIMGLLLLLSYWFIYSQMKPGKSQFTRMGAYALLVTTVALTFDKVLSPQYLIWLIPFIPLIFSPFRNTILVIFVAIGSLTYLIFPTHYLALLATRTDLVVILLLRNILLCLLAVMAVVSLRQMKPSD